MVNRFMGMLLLLLLSATSWSSHSAEPRYRADFEQANQAAWSLLLGCAPRGAVPRNGDSALRCEIGSSAFITKQALAELGVLELWVRPENEFTSYKIAVSTSESVKLDSVWTPVSLIEQSPETPSYRAHRIAIDDVSAKFVRLDIDAYNGSVFIDDIKIDQIALAVALQKNEQKIVSNLLEQLQQDKQQAVQAESIRALASSYLAQLESQRQYLEYANGIYASITFVLATGERNKMANPLGYKTFTDVLTDTKRVASPLQQARLNSMVKPFGDLATATLSVVSGGTYAAFAEPFKSFLAATFDKSNYENSDLSRKDRKFAEQNGLAIYEKAEKFLAELEKEMQRSQELERELQNLQITVDKYRKDLDKQLRDVMQHAGLARTQENFSKVMSKDEAVRVQIYQDMRQNMVRRADNLANNKQNAELVQYLLRSNDYIDNALAFRERFNGVTAQVLTFYEQFERAISKEQNPFTDTNDKAVWEAHAVLARAYLQQSKDAFKQAYM